MLGRRVSTADQLGALQYLTLLFIGCISASSLRGFLKNMSKVPPALTGMPGCLHLTGWHLQAGPALSGQLPPGSQTRAGELEASWVQQAPGLQTGGAQHADCTVCAQFFFAVAGGGNGRSLVLVLTELTGMYCISSVLLIRKQLPLQYRCGCAKIPAVPTPALRSESSRSMMHSCMGVH